MRDGCSERRGRVPSAGRLQIMMRYRGKYRIFDPSRIETYPLAMRSNKVQLADLVSVPLRKGGRAERAVPAETAAAIDGVAEAIVRHRHSGKPVVVFAGAHVIKNGMGPIIVDIVKRGMITLVAGNGATAIHDFELALIGQTSEDVPNALGQGRFGMASEFAYINAAMTVGDRGCLGCGESLGRVICDGDFRREVLAEAGLGDSTVRFGHRGVSVLAACYERDVPFTVHVGIGTDVTDQHASFDGAAKGGCSGRDFLIYTDEICRCVDGGVVVNIGSAVTGPEVLLKAVSMAANVGLAPKGIVTADFDLRPEVAGDMTDEAEPGYYFRDQKSVARRVPEAFGGAGHYIKGNHKATVRVLYNRIIERL